MKKSPRRPKKKVVSRSRAITRGRSRRRSNRPRGKDGRFLSRADAKAGETLSKEASSPRVGLGVTAKRVRESTLGQWTHGILPATYDYPTSHQYKWRFEGKNAVAKAGAVLKRIHSVEGESLKPMKVRAIVEPKLPKDFFQNPDDLGLRELLAEQIGVHPVSMSEPTYDSAIAAFMFLDDGGFWGEYTQKGAPPLEANAVELSLISPINLEGDYGFPKRVKPKRRGKPPRRNPVVPSRKRKAPPRRKKSKSVRVHVGGGAKQSRGKNRGRNSKTRRR